MRARKDSKLNNRGFGHKDVVGSYPLTEVARMCGGVHISTVWRWMLSGVRGVKLESIMLGGKRYVRGADLDTFLATLNGCEVQSVTTISHHTHDLDHKLNEAGL